jgi:hypothetical protein
MHTGDETFILKKRNQGGCLKLAAGKYLRIADAYAKD